MSRFLERLYPYAAPLIAVALCWWCGATYPKEKDILSSSVTMGAIFTGFLATLMSMVVSLAGPRMDEFRATKFYPTLIGYLKEAIYLSLLFCAWNLAGYFYPASVEPPRLFGAGWVWLAGASLLSFQRFSSLLLSLMTK